MPLFNWNQSNNNSSNNSNNSSTKREERQSPYENPHNYRQVGENRYEDEKTGKRYDQWGNLIDD